LARNVFRAKIFAREKGLIVGKNGPKWFRPEKLRVFKISTLKFSGPGTFAPEISRHPRHLDARTSRAGHDPHEFAPQENGSMEIWCSKKSKSS
jgi:hypothetical protein